MIEVLGETYFIDLDSVDNTINMDKEIVPSGETHVNIAKYEIVKIMIETIMTEAEEDMDESLGKHNMSKLSIPFRIAFNTLLNNKILKHY